MAIGDLNPAVWRIDVYELDPKVPFSGVITDLSNLYTSDLSITKQRNYPDEIRFTLDLKQLEERAQKLDIQSRDIIQPYRHKIRCYRNNKFMAQGIVVKTTANLNNESKNTLEVQCVDTLGLLEKRLIHQDYGEGSWADFAKNVIYDAQHEPNRIYNYAWEGDGVSVNNAWFRGWKFLPGEDTLRDFPEWEPNHLYSMYDTCTHDAKFWEAKEHAFYSGETFSESNWTLLGILDEETGDVEAAYGVWREDNEEPGPTGTALGGWGGTSSCHMTSKSFGINNGGSISSISMKDSSVSTSLVAPFEADEGAPRLPADYQEVEYIESTSGGTSSSEHGAYIDTGLNLKQYNSRLKITTDIDVTAYNNSWNTIYGAAYGLKNGTWYWNPQFQLAIVVDNRPRVEYPITAGTGTSTTGQIICNDKTVAGSRKTIVLDALGNIPTLTIDGTTYNGDTDLGDSDDYGPDCSFFIGARNYLNPDSGDASHIRGAYCTPMKIYSVVIEGKHGVIRDLVPCYSRTGGEVGMYDLAQGKFHPELGEENFIPGPEVMYPSEHEVHTFISHSDPVVHAGTPVISSVDDEQFGAMYAANYPEYVEQDIAPYNIIFTDQDSNHSSCYLEMSPQIGPLTLWEGTNLDEAKAALAPWGIILADNESS